MLHYGFLIKLHTLIEQENFYDKFMFSDSLITNLKLVFVRSHQVNSLKRSLKTLNYNMYFQGCPDPPKLPAFVSRKISFTHIADEYWTDTVLTYECEPMHSFLFGASNTRVCGRNGQWDDGTAPRCVPGLLKSSFHTSQRNFTLLWYFAQ